MSQKDGFQQSCHPNVMCNTARRRPAISFVALKRCTGSHYASTVHNHRGGSRPYRDCNRVEVISGAQKTGAQRRNEVRTTQLITTSVYQSHGHPVGSPQELRRPFMSQSCRTEFPSVMRKHWKIRGIKENICNVA